MNEHFPFTLPELPYPAESLEPILSKETLFFHHEKHFSAYIDALNAAVKPYPRYQTWTLTELYQNAPSMPREIRETVLINSGAVMNHDLYFRCMIRPQPTEIPRGALRYAIDRYFGSFSEFLQAFVTSALDILGSGWLFLATDPNGRLKLVQTQQHFTPLSEKLYPLLVIDMWEHAYYLQYQNRRKEYAENWVTLINWKEVQNNYRTFYAQ